MVRKNIDIDKTTLTKLKIISAFENKSVKVLMEKAVSFFVEYKEKERLSNLTEEEKEDLGLWLLMQEGTNQELATEEEVRKELLS